MNTDGWYNQPAEVPPNGSFNTNAGLFNNFSHWVL